MIFFTDEPAGNNIRVKRSVSPDFTISLTSLLYHSTCVIMYQNGRFRVMKCRILDTSFTSDIVKLYLGINVNNVGKIISKQDLMLFLLKYSNLHHDVICNYPILHPNVEDFT
jgi:hypothetical protein